MQFKILSASDARMHAEAERILNCIDALGPSPTHTLHARDTTLEKLDFLCGISGVGFKTAACVLVSPCVGLCYLLHRITLCSFLMLVAHSSFSSCIVIVLSAVFCATGDSTEPQPADNRHPCPAGDVGSGLVPQVWAPLPAPVAPSRVCITFDWSIN